VEPSCAASDSVDAVVLSELCSASPFVAGTLKDSELASFGTGAASTAGLAGARELAIEVELSIGAGGGAEAASTAGIADVELGLLASKPGKDFASKLSFELGLTSVAGLAGAASTAGPAGAWLKLLASKPGKTFAFELSFEAGAA